MTDAKQQLLDWIDADKDRLIAFFSGFLQAKSPNPPGDTRVATAFITRFLDEHGVPYRLIAPQETMPNIVGSYEGGQPGRHLVLNGHIDVFPAAEPLEGERDPWSGAVEDGRIYGRGASDMKCGTSASIFTFVYLNRLRDRIKGRLTLTCVSDEETGGKWGTRYLMENHGDEVRGDCCLNGEPSGVSTIRFGEKGTLRLIFTARTPGAHGAYPHKSKSATKVMGQLIGELESLVELEPQVPDNVAKALAGDSARTAADDSLGAGAYENIKRLTVNIGVLRGGLKVNMLPGECVMEADIRMPVGLDKPTVMGAISQILTRYPEVGIQEKSDHTYPSSVCDPGGEMVGIVQANVERLKGFRPVPIVSLGGSDARYWRWRDIPAYLYGPSPITMGTRDEHVTIDEFFHVVRTHVLSAYDYLSRA